MSTIRCCDTPQKMGPSMHVRRLAEAETVRVLIYSPRPKGIWTHWMGTASLPCTEPREQCKGCRAQASIRQKFLLHVGCQNTKAEEVLELPPQATRDLMSQFPPCEAIRGQHLRITRGSAKTARLKIEILERWNAVLQGPLPAEKDPRIPLLELWGLDPKLVSFAEEVAVV